MEDGFTDKNKSVQIRQIRVNPRSVTLPADSHTNRIRQASYMRRHSGALLVVFIIRYIHSVLSIKGSNEFEHGWHGFTRIGARVP